MVPPVEIVYPPDDEEEDDEEDEDDDEYDDLAIFWMFVGTALALEVVWYIAGPSIPPFDEPPVV